MGMPEGLCTKCSATGYCQEHDPLMSVPTRIFCTVCKKDVLPGHRCPADVQALIEKVKSLPRYVFEPESKR